MTLLLSPARRRRAVQAFAVAALAMFLSPGLAQEQTPPAATPAPATAAPAPATSAPAPAATPPAATATTPSSVDDLDAAPAPAAPSAATPAAPGTSTTAQAPASPAPASPPVSAPASATPAPAANEPAPSTEPQADAPSEPAAAPDMLLAPSPESATAGDADAAAAASLPHDLSPWGMFMAADIVVKAVMGGLAFASVVTFTILLAKGVEIAFAKARARRSIRRLVEAETLGEAIGEEGRRRRWRGPIALLARSAEDERRRSAGLSADGIKERVAIALSRVEAGAGRSITRGTGLLATIGSTAPFVGLFGTVWGIMNSFIGISQANTTNLAVVAPGIAEALLATAIGLVAAIPAVVIYNVFARSISGYRAILADGSALVMQHLSRQLDRAEIVEAAPPRAHGRVAAAAE